MSNIIELKKVNKWFDKFQVLKDIDLEVKTQEKIVICGPSGSGKSTLIRCINRLENHQEGKIIVDNVEISDEVHITAMSLITKSIKEPGTYSSGTPFMKNKDWKKNAVLFKKLNKLIK